MPPSTQGSLGYGDARRVVVVGERVAEGIALYYQRKYDAVVWFTPSEGVLADSTSKILKGIGPSYAMRALARELKSINYTVGRWEILIPKIAEGYFLTTLKHMPTNSLSKARGMVVLIDSSGNADMEQEVQRVSDGNIFVSYEFQK